MKIFIKSKNNREQIITKKVLNLLKNLEIKTTKNPREANLAITIGGDGTFLLEQSLINCPILGIKTKGVGYYLSASKKDYLKNVNKVLKGKEGKDYYVHKLSRLKATLNGKSLPLALNEYLISSGFTRKMFNAKIKINGKKSRERNSGIIVYTPTGSNAFARSAGAKKLNWNEKKIGVIALAPYFGILKKRKFLLNRREIIIIECLNKTGEICIDGQNKYTYKIKYGDKIMIRKSNKYAMVIGFNKN